MPKAADPQNVVILTQAISTHWEKSARGGANATLRNRVPEALKVPKFSASNVSTSYVLHSASYGGKNGFAEPITNVVEVSIAEPDPDRLNGISLDLAFSILTVFYQYNSSHGAPGRYSRKTEALNLSLGQWGRVQYNGRCSWGDYWWYEKHIYNIGLFRNPQASVFTQSEPMKTFSQMAHLF